MAYQEIAGTRRSVSAAYVLDADLVRLRLGAYDPTRPLVIDPVIDYSTYLGGSNGDAGLSIAVDGAGRAYVTGYTSSTDFPTVNPHRETVRACGL